MRKVGDDQGFKLDVRSGVHLQQSVYCGHAGYKNIQHVKAFRLRPQMKKFNAIILHAAHAAHTLAINSVIPIVARLVFHNWKEHVNAPISFVLN